MGKDFSSFYRDVFAELARPLTPADAIPGPELDAAERRVGGRLPAALRAFYAVAGRVRGFDHAADRLATPAEWFVDRGRMVILAGDRDRVRYGVTAEARRDDPGVHVTRRRGSVFSPWQRAGARCSDFLVLRVCLQAASGGMPYTGYAHVGRATGEAVAARLGPGRRCRDLWAVHAPGRVVCLAGPLRSEGMGYDVLVGGRSAADFRDLTGELADAGVELADVQEPTAPVADADRVG